MSTYNKDDVKALGEAVYRLIEGLSNGVGAEEIANLTSVLAATPAAVNELRDDFDAAGLHIAAHLADRFGDRQVNPPTP